MDKKNNILAICFRFPPETYPAANRLGKILKYLKKDWQIDVLTAAKDGFLDERVNVTFVKPLYPNFLLKLIAKLKLKKISDLLIWPDIHVFWVIPATVKAYRLIKQNKPDVIVNFMMPYSAGLVGIMLKWLTGLPLVMNLGDSPTCSDMNSSYPTLIHYYMAHWLEDFFIQQSDAIIYVSQFNLERVKTRQPKHQQFKFHLIRGGADPADFRIQDFHDHHDNFFTIAYIGGMNGWYQFYTSPEKQSFLKRLYQEWMKLGRYTITTLDYRSSSPIFIGKAIQQAMIQNPDWEEKINIKVYGNTYDPSVIEKVLTNHKLEKIISVFNPIPNTQAIQVANQADLLFMTLPDRPDGSVGGRISLKTYEYLMTDRPILAAVPKGENRDYLADKPGVWLVEPTDVSAMAKAITDIVSAKFSGKPLKFDRSCFREELSYANHAQKLDKILEKVCSKS